MTKTKSFSDLLSKQVDKINNPYGQVVKHRVPKKTTQQKKTIIEQPKEIKSKEIDDSEAFIKTKEFKYLYPSTQGLLKHELGLAKQGKPNELSTRLPKTKKKALIAKETFDTKQAEESKKQEELMRLELEQRTPKQIERELIQIKKRMDLLNARHDALGIGVMAGRTQRHAHIENELDAKSRRINFLMDILNKINK